MKKLLSQAQRDISSGDITNTPELPQKFSRTLNEILRKSLAYGYWLNHLYVQELKAASKGKKYNGKITLSDLPDDEEIRNALNGFISFGSPNEWLNSYTPNLAGVLQNDVLEKTRDVIRNSMLEGSTLKERMQTLREAAPELSSMTQHRIEAIARTEITRADTMGRLVSMKANDDVIGVEFSAVMDDRTTDICASRHGLVMRLDDPRLPENTPPLHVNCRSLLISATVYDYPDGLLTSHEFEEISPAQQRPEDIEEVAKILTPNEEPPAKPTMHTQNVIIDAGTDSMKKLVELSKEGIMPAHISGTREEQARIFKEIDKLYDNPEYLKTGRVTAEVKNDAKSVEVAFHGKDIEGLIKQAVLPSGKEAEKEERGGVIKYLLHTAWVELEVRILNKHGVLTEAERMLLETLGSVISPEAMEIISLLKGE